MRTTEFCIWEQVPYSLGAADINTKEQELSVFLSPSVPQLPT